MPLPLVIQDGSGTQMSQESKWPTLDFICFHYLCILWQNPVFIMSNRAPKWHPGIWRRKIKGPAPLRGEGTSTMKWRAGALRKSWPAQGRQLRPGSLRSQGQASTLWLLNDDRRPSPHQLLWGSKCRLQGQVLAWSLLGQPTVIKIILDELSSNVELRPCSRWQGPEHHRFSVSEQWLGPHFTAWTLSCRAFAPPSRGTSD